MKKLEASELRIGNYVRAKSPEISTFTEPVEVCITYLEMFCRPRQAVHFEPIPLTEDWLLKFGWSKNGNEIDTLNQLYDLDQNKIPFTLMSGDIGFWLIENWVSPRNLCHIEIKYVHQLQNLCFALTGEELTLTPRRDKN